MSTKRYTTLQLLSLCVYINTQRHNSLLHYYNMRTPWCRCDIVDTWHVKCRRPAVIFSQPSARWVSDNRAYKTSRKSKRSQPSTFRGRSPSRPHSVYAGIYDSLDGKQINTWLAIILCTQIKKHDHCILRTSNTPSMTLRTITR